MYRRGVIPVVFLLGLVLLALFVQLLAAAGPPAASGTHAKAPPAPARASARAIPAGASAPLRTLSRIQHAFDAGDVVTLCKPGMLVDAAVIADQNAQGGCETELETLIATDSPMRLGVEAVTLKRDLAIVTVATRTGTTPTVDLVRNGGSWLLSFSDGDDPMPALAGSG